MDFRFGLKPVDSERASSIVIIGIADSSFQLAGNSPELLQSNPVLEKISQPWPWDRSVFAHAAEKLFDAGARMVVFDLVFAGQNPGDGALGKVLRDHSDKAVLGAYIVQQESELGELQMTCIEPSSSITGEPAPLVDSGYVNVWVDRDDNVRYLTPYINLNNPRDIFDLDRVPKEELLKSLSLSACQKLYPEKTINSGRASNLLFSLSGPAGWHPMIPIEDLFLEDRWNGPVINEGHLFKGKIVFIGPWSEIRFKDYLLTHGERMAGVEIHANMLQSLLDESLVATFPLGAELLFCLLLLMAAAFTLIFAKKALWQVIILAAIFSTYTVINLILFFKAALCVPYFAPVAALGIMSVFNLSVDYFLEARQKSRIRQILDIHVSPQVAKLVVNQRDQFEASMQGKRLPVTVLFMDIRGFTTLSEKFPPEVFVTQLNECFREIVDCILENQGTLQKFIGDAILAVWGDTISQGRAEDARRAVDSSILMLDALEKLNESWQDNPDRAPLSIGIGINEGEALVGYIGHPKRREFTVMGDTVNLASRLEGATKFFGQKILVGGSVRQLTENHFHYRTVGLVRVKGKTKAIEVFTPLGRKGEEQHLSYDWLEYYESAVRQFQSGVLNEVEVLLDKCESRQGRKDPLCQIYLDECRKALKAGAADRPDWDGSIILTSK